MTHRASICFTVLASFVFGVFAVPPKVARDWAKDPAVVQVETSADVYAVGDVHGDYERLVTLLAGAKILGGIPASPSKPSWIADKAVVVFTGDLIDKGPRALSVIEFTGALRAQAAAAGGRVIVLMGNHEVEFLADPSSEKTQEFAAELRAAGLQPAVVAHCEGDVGRFLCALPMAARVNDWFFAHAGNSAGRTMARLEADLENGVDRAGFGTEQLVGANSLLEARIGEKGPGGRAWFEAAASGAGAEPLLAAYAAALGVHHIVEGHHRAAVRFPDEQERKPGEMFQWHGLLFLIDTGLSREIDDSAGAVLHIRAGAHPSAEAICGDGHVSVIWDSAHSGGSGKAAPCGVKE